MPNRRKIAQRFCDKNIDFTMARSGYVSGEDYAKEFLKINYNKLLKVTDNYYSPGTYTSPDLISNIVEGFSHATTDNKFKYYANVYGKYWNSQINQYLDAYRALSILNHTKEIHGCKPNKAILLVCANADFVDNLMNAIDLLFKLKEDYTQYNFYVCNDAAYKKTALFNALVPEQNIIKEMFSNTTNFKGAPFDVIVFQACPPVVFNGETVKVALGKLKPIGGKIVIQKPNNMETLEKLCPEPFLNVVKQQSYHSHIINLSGPLANEGIPQKELQKVTHVFEIKGAQGGAAKKRSTKRYTKKSTRRSKITKKKASIRKQPIRR